jgi:hypothetical protein
MLAATRREMEEMITELRTLDSFSKLTRGEKELLNRTNPLRRTLHGVPTCRVLKMQLRHDLSTLDGRDRLVLTRLATTLAEYHQRAADRRHTAEIARYHSTMGKH